MCVWERESMCIQSRPHWATSSPSSALWWQCFYLVVCVFVCMHMDSQGLIKRSLMMLVISILTHVTSGHPDWITPHLRQGNTWLHNSRPWNFHTAQPKSSEKKVKQKRQNSPKFGKQNDLYYLKTDQSWKTSCLLLTALSETSVVPTVPWRYWTKHCSLSLSSTSLCFRCDPWKDKRRGD